MGNRAAQIRAATQAAHPGATVQRIGKNWIEHHLPDGTMSLDIAIADLHYNTDQEIDTTIVGSDDSAFDDMVTTTPYRVYHKNGNRRIYPRRDILTEWIELGPPEFQRANLTWSPIPWTGKQRNDNVVTLTRPDAQLQLSFGPGRMKTNLVISSLPTSTRWRFPISIIGLTRQGANLIADSDGTIIATVAPFTLEDSSDDRIRRDIDGQFTAHPTYQGAYQIEPDLSGLTYPVIIDPTIDVNIAAGGDDGSWYTPSGTLFTSGALNIGKFDASTTYGCFMRFTGIAIPQGSTISSASITITETGVFTATTVNGILSGEASDNPSAPTTYADATGRSITTATVAWSNISSFSSGGTRDTPDITTIIQEIINRGGWTSGNALIVFIKDNGTTSGNIQRQFAAYENASYSEPILHVTGSWVSGGQPMWTRRGGLWAPRSGRIGG